MPSETSKKIPAAALPSIPQELIDQMVSGPMDAGAVNAASMAFKKALIERALGPNSAITWVTRPVPGNLAKAVTIAMAPPARPC